MKHNATAVEDPKHPGEWTASCPDCDWTSATDPWWSPDGHSVQAASEAREHNRDAK
jgi:hypothetical protein